MSAPYNGSDAYGHGAPTNAQDEQTAVLAQPIIKDVDRKFTWRKFGTIVACGAALFSDGYVNNSIGIVLAILKKESMYKSVMAANHRTETLTAVAYGGTILGMLSFGYISDVIGRKNGMIIATLIILVFTALMAGSYYKGDAAGMIDMLIAWRFMTGIGIGAEYPTGSVAAAEKSEEMPKRFQHGPFILVTNFAIDMGFVISAFVPLVLTWIFGEEHNRVIWRMTIGLGVVPCLVVLPFRLLMEQTKIFTKGAIRFNKIPYRLIIKRYWFRLVVISLVWFIYDFVSYPFGLYSSIITGHFMGDNASQVRNFGWSVVINCFYLPGSLAGALFVDTLGPKKTLAIGLGLQIIIGFIMSGLFAHFQNHIAVFCVIYGLFLTFGEFGPGDNLGLLASKSCATCAKGQFYGLAAAIGKCGALAGSYAIPALQAHFDTTDNRYYTAPFYLGSGLACVSLLLAVFLIKERPADCQAQEDEDFRLYLAQNGFDLRNMGTNEKVATEELGDKDSEFDEKYSSHPHADEYEASFSAQPQTFAAPHPHDTQGEHIVPTKATY